MCLDMRVAAGLSANAVTVFLSTLTGALVLANALGDTGAYDRATKDLLRPCDVLVRDVLRPLIGRPERLR
jgi:hypothetical protein